MAATFLSGKAAKVRYGGSNYVLPMKQWDLDPHNTALDVTNAESGGKGEYRGSIDDADLTLEFDQDWSQNMFTNGLVVGARVHFYLYVNDTAGPFWDGYVQIESVPTSARVRDTVGGRLTGKFSGGFSYPVGITSN